LRWTRLPPANFNYWVWDSETKKEILTIKEHTGNVLSLAFSPDGKRIVGGHGGNDGLVKVWDAENGQEIFTLKGHNRDVISVA
jgi:WD40 repeat protein